MLNIRALFMLFQRGPPWYQRTLIITLGLGIVVVLLGGAIAYLWYTKGDHTFSPDSGESADTIADEQRVTKLISAADGQMAQQELITRTDWSEAKVSRVTSRMAEEGDIEKLRIGRQNVLQVLDDDEDG